MAKEIIFVMTLPVFGKSVVCMVDGEIISVYDEEYAVDVTDLVDVERAGLIYEEEKRIKALRKIAQEK